MVAQMTKTQKAVTVLNVYKFNHIARICFIVESSDGSQTYNTCFSGDAEHGTCGCDGNAVWHKVCKHITNLRPRAQAYFDSRKPVATYRDLATNEIIEVTVADGIISEQKMDEMAAYYLAEDARQTARINREMAFDGFR